jgi:hypothetical protein
MYSNYNHRLERASKKRIGVLVHEEKRRSAISHEDHEASVTRQGLCIQLTDQRWKTGGPGSTKAMLH